VKLSPTLQMSLAGVAAVALVLGLAACHGGATAKVANPPTFAVDDSVKPPVPSIEDSGAQHPVAALRDSHGNVTSFVADELIVRLPDKADEKATVAEWGATVLDREVLPPEMDGGTLLLVRVDGTKGNVDQLSANAHRLQPMVGGSYSVSSGQALQLIALAYQVLAGGGPTVNLNFLGRPAGLVDDVVARNVSDNPAVTPRNVFDWPYMRTGGAQDIGVGEAWRMLALAGKITDQPQRLIKIAIMDAGFIRTPDLPNLTVFNGSFDRDGRTAPNAAGCSTGPGCQWHGSDVSHTLAALPANGQGVAGPAGPVADLLLMQSPTNVLTFFSFLIEFPRMVLNHPRIINISADFELSPVLFAIANAAGDLLAPIRLSGTLIFGAAGNKHTNVDATDCFPAGVCWESQINMPCELHHVICVGGLGTDSSAIDGGSNFGAADHGLDGQGVDIYGPYHVFAPETPDLTRIVTASGTSVAAPFVAGVAALIWAANPDRSADDVERILLTTAHRGGGAANGYLWVDAAAAVHAALGPVCEPPTAQILQPQPDAVVAADDPVTFRGVGMDRGAELPGPALTWSVDGVHVGNGTTLRHDFATAGRHTVSITARGCSAVPTTRTMGITVRRVNTAPGQVTILYPSDHASLFATGVEGGVSFVDVILSGTARYADGSAVPASRLHWRSSIDNDLGPGANPAVRLHSGNCVNGVHVLTLEAFAADGITSIGTATVTVTVLSAPC
jgi:serine protease